MKSAQLLTIALLFAVSPQVYADKMPEDNSFEVGASMGLFFPNTDHEWYSFPDNMQVPLSSAAFDIGLRLGYVPVKFFALEGEFHLLPTTDDNSRTATLIGYHLQMLFQFPAMITPFATVGVGGIGVSSASNALGDDADAVGIFGLGAKYFITDSLSLRLEGRLTVGPKVEPITDPGGSGTAHFGILAGVTWSFGKTTTEEEEPPPPPVDPDPDRDGVLGAADKCPDVAGEGPDGCPPKDSDGDGMMDANDKCPFEAETVNGYNDTDGCPDEIPDTDGDGINDIKDGCIRQPEDFDGFEDEDGCPDLDNDGDKVIDSADNCPNVKGPIENRGCPDTDRDGDGVVDRLDNCPDVAGTAKNQGCKKKQLVILTSTQIKILDKVYFRTNKAKLQRRSRRLLNNVAAVIIAHAEIAMVRIEGHTDDKGDDAANKELSQKRAEAVVAYLVGKGVAEDRLKAVGFGEENPIEDNKTRKGRSANRRVEFLIEAPAK